MSQPCCAHRKVKYVRVEQFGLCSDKWECADCGMPFKPSPFKFPKDRTDIMQEISDAEPKGPVFDGPRIRQFSTGATRDIDDGKHDPEGFLSPLVIQRYNEFMHLNRHQKDGQLRDSDNWQKGIPKDAYAKSLWRHLLDFWLAHRGYKAREDIETALCAIIFNACGYLFEILKHKHENQAPRS